MSLNAVVPNLLFPRLVCSFTNTFFHLSTCYEILRQYNIIIEFVYNGEADFYNTLAGCLYNWLFVCTLFFLFIFLIYRGWCGRAERTTQLPWHWHSPAHKLHPLSIHSGSLVVVRLFGPFFFFIFFLPVHTLSSWWIYHAAISLFSHYNKRRKVFIKGNEKVDGVIAL